MIATTSGHGTQRSSSNEQNGHRRIDLALFYGSNVDRGLHGGQRSLGKPARIEPEGDHRYPRG